MPSITHAPSDSLFHEATAEEYRRRKLVTSLIRESTTSNSSGKWQIWNTETGVCN